MNKQELLEMAAKVLEGLKHHGRDRCDEPDDKACEILGDLAEMLHRLDYV